MKAMSPTRSSTGSQNESGGYPDILDWKPEGARGGFRDRYELGKFLGSGTFGDVWVCSEKPGDGGAGAENEYACKVIQKASLKTEEERMALRKEIRMLEKLKGRHPGVVQLRQVTESERAVQVVMELCKGGDLFDLLKSRGRLPEPAARMVFRQLASALAFCHSQGILHRDIKPENILFSQPATRLYKAVSPDDPLPDVQAKLSDFGLAEFLTPGEVTEGYVGSRHYVAPEMILSKKYGRRVDVWSLGVVLCAMLTGKLPFHGKTPSDAHGLKRAIVRGQVDFGIKAWVGVSEEAKDLVRKMLELEPARRIRSCDILVHPWCQGATLQDGGSGPAAPIAVASASASQRLGPLSSAEFPVIAESGDEREQEHELRCGEEHASPLPALLTAASMDLDSRLPADGRPEDCSDSTMDVQTAEEVRQELVDGGAHRRGGLQGFCHRVIASCAREGGHLLKHGAGKHGQRLLDVLAAVTTPQQHEV